MSLRTDVDFCIEVQQDARAFAKCEYMRENLNYTKEKFDKPILYVTHKDKNTAVSEWKDPGEKLIPQQINQAAYKEELVEEKLVQDKIMDGGKFETPFRNFVKSVDDFVNPLLSSSKSQLIFDQLEINTIKSTLKDEGLKIGTAEYEEALVDALENYMLRPEFAGGLGISSFNTICTNYTITLLRLCRLAGLENTGAVAVFTDSNGNTACHVRPSITLSNGKTIYRDIYMDISPKQKTAVVSESDLTSYYLNYEAVIKHPNDDEAQKLLLGAAKGYSKSSETTYMNLGYFDVNDGNLEASLENFLEAYRRNPYNPHTLYYLFENYSRLSQKEKADEFCNQYKELTGRPKCEAERFWLSSAY